MIYCLFSSVDIVFLFFFSYFGISERIWNSMAAIYVFIHVISRTNLLALALEIDMSMI